MKLEKICFAQSVDEFEKSFNFVLPESGIEPVSFPDASTDYVTKPEEILTCS
jgi:hypothetical protein